MTEREWQTLVREAAQAAFDRLSEVEQTRLEELYWQYRAELLRHRPSSLFGVKSFLELVFKLACGDALRQLKRTCGAG